MRSFALALVLGITFLSGCGTIQPRKDLPIAKYEGKEFEFAFIRGSVNDEVFVALGKSGWKEVGGVPGDAGFYPTYVLIREKK